MNLKKILIDFLKTVAIVITALILFYIAVVAFLILMFSTQNGHIYSIAIFVMAMLIEATVIGAFVGVIKKKSFYLPICIGFGVCIITCASVWGYQSYIDSIPTVGESEDLLDSYAPYAEDTKTVTLDEESDLIITENLPVMDGATALYPIYSGFAKAVYPKEFIDITAGYKKSDYLKCSTTTGAYKKIVTGEADIIFAALPSEEQKKYAEDNGVELVYTPIGKEAFVFFVNSKNPIDDISLEDVQKIYSGEITEWSELGVKGLGYIKAFQRDEGSGSQSTLQKLMAGKSLMTPPKEDVIDAMGGIIEKTSDYKNFKNAIGYSFRFYSTEMVKNNKIKLLSVNGVYPSLENIENGTYPIASYFYAVTRSDADENVLKLLEWITGEQGQKIVEMTGYAPLDE